MSDYDDFCRSLEWEESLKDYEQESFEREVLGYTYDHEEYKECECECEGRGSSVLTYGLKLVFLLASPYLHQ